MPGFTFLRGRAARSAATAVLLAGTALGGFAAGSVTFADTPAAAPGAVNAGAIPAAVPAPDFSNLVERVAPAVVSITSEITPTQASDDSQDDQSQGGEQGMPRLPFPFAMPMPHGHQAPAGREEARGSGFLIDANGTIVTNNHVIAHAKSVSVTLADGTTLPAKIVGRDPGSDLAVLRIKADGRKLPFLQLGDSNAVRVGQWVIAVGNPFGLSGTVTAGIVSARGRDIGDGPFNTSFIQVDAPINRGNSGGPLLTQDGKVVGVNTAILSPTGGSVGIGFAIPSEMVRNVVDQIEANGHVTRGYLGVQAQAITPALASALHLSRDDGDTRAPDKQGALIADVQADSPAAQAGLKSGDIIQAVDGKMVGNPGQLVQLIAGMQPGKTATLSVLRDGDVRKVDVTLATRPGEQQTADAGTTAHHAATVGLSLAPLTPDLRDQLSLPEGTRGAVIAEVKPGSPAEAAGLQQNDIILGVGDHAVASPRDARTAIEAARKGGQSVALRVLHEGHKLFVAIPAASDDNAG
jgi:serine protease Do